MGCMNIAAYNNQWVNPASFCLNFEMDSGNAGGTCLRRHISLSKTNMAIVSPIDLCKAKNQLLSSLPLGKSTIYHPRPNKVITRIAITQCNNIAVKLYLSCSVIIQIHLYRRLSHIQCPDTLFETRYFNHNYSRQ